MKLCSSFSDETPCSTCVDVLVTGYRPILSSLPLMKNSGMTRELDPKGHKTTCPSFGMYSSPAEYSTMGHYFGLDESCVPVKNRVSDFFTQGDM